MVAKSFIGGMRATNRYKICHGRVTGAPEAAFAVHMFYHVARYTRGTRRFASTAPRLSRVRVSLSRTRRRIARGYRRRLTFRRITATRDSAFAPSPNKLTGECSHHETTAVRN